MENELDIKDLANIIEAVLFALGREIKLLELVRVLQIEEEKIVQAIEILKEKYAKGNVIELSNVKDTYALVTNSKYYKHINKFVENTKKQNLSTSALETLTIIAYNPKITKAEIERIRGVNSDFAVGRLLECGLIEEVRKT